MFNGCNQTWQWEIPVSAMDQQWTSWIASLESRHAQGFTVVSMDWFKEMLQENSMFYGRIMENLYKVQWFPVAFPLNHSIDSCNTNPKQFA